MPRTEDTNNLVEGGAHHHHGAGGGSNSAYGTVGPHLYPNLHDHDLGNNNDHPVHGHDHALHPNYEALEHVETNDFDHNAFATKKTAALGLMDVCLLTDNAYQLRTLTILWEGNGYQITQLAFVVISIVMQIILGIMLLLIGKLNTNCKEDCPKATKYQNCATILLFLITVINIFVASFHMIDINPDHIVPAHTHEHMGKGSSNSLT